MRLLVTAICIGLLLFSLKARSEVDRAEWTEEVRLANGDMVVVKRTATRDQKPTAVTRRGALRSWEVIFPDERAAWTGYGTNRPAAMEIAGGTAYIAAHIRSRELCAKYNNPKGSVVFFRWSKGEWMRIPIDQYPTGGKVNLLQNPWGRARSDDVRGFIKHQDKHQPGRAERLIGVPLTKLIEDRARDACELYKKI